MTAGIALLFPGQGSQSLGMGRALYDAFPIAKRTYEEASAIVRYDMAALCFDGPAERLNSTEFTQPALLTASIAAYRACAAADFQPVAVAGHSLGEYSALVAAGAVSFADAVGLVQKRGRYMAEAVPPGTGLVAALLGPTPEVARRVCQEASSIGVVAAANFNCPGQVVIAGEKAAVERAIELAKANGVRKAIPLPVSVPVHTPLMQSAADRLAADLAKAQWRTPVCPIVNNAEARAISQAADIVPSLIRQLPSSVLWEDSIAAMAAMGVGTFVEIGPGTVLTGLVKRIQSTAVTYNVHDPATVESTRAALGRPAVTA
ncbi:MAG: ACP S-malonyltransferase [Nitrospiraceae bacterium]